MDWSQLFNILIAALGTLLTGLATWATTRLVTFLNSKIKDKEAAKHLTNITTITMNAVQAVFQTYVESLKKQNAFTEESQKEALEKCLAIIKNQLTPELIAYITENFGDLEKYLKTLVESTIYKLKN